MSCAAHALASSRNMLVAEDVDLICWAVRQFPAYLDVEVLDVGAGSGTTALAVFAARARRITVTAIDNSPKNLAWAREAVKNIGRADDFTTEHRDSADSSDWLLPIDLLLLDAMHTYEGVHAELAAWLPHMARGGYVWVHDYGNPADFGWGELASPGVKRAVDQAMFAGTLVEIDCPLPRGLGWLGRKAS